MARLLANGLTKFLVAYLAVGALGNESVKLDPGHDKLGAVASENKMCSQIGIDMLTQGGTAADAMAATVFCVGTTSMYHSGIGGGGFMLVRSSNGSYEFINFRETAPAAASKNMYEGNYNGSLYGGLSRSGVPGELRGIEHLHNCYGKLPWSTVIAPSIKLARYGFKVDADLVSYIKSAIEGQDNFLVNDPSWAIDFAPNGTLVKLNDTIYRKRYADTLETISMFGADAFYTGAIANATITAVRAANGTMTLDDLKNYKLGNEKPSQISYRNFTLTSCSAPSSGEVALATMKIVEGFDDFGEESALNISTYRLNEAMRFAYGERTNLGDPAFVPGVLNYENEMISERVASEKRANITADTHPVSYYDVAGLASLNDHGTSEIATADASGMAITLTTTVNLLFGSQVMVPETGVIMNDEMNDFSIPDSSNAFGYIPTPNNFIAPGKRPLSSISPTIAEHASNHSLYFITGAAGGSRIITAVVQNLWFVLDRGMDCAQALKEPRLHDQLVPNTVSFEYAYDNETVAFLESRGCNASFIAPGESTAQAIRLLPNGTFEAAGEPRQDNSAGIVI